jgi:hypothetical protein
VVNQTPGGNGGTPPEPGAKNRKVRDPNVQARKRRGVANGKATAADVKRPRYKVAPVTPAVETVPAAREETLLTTEQMRAARKLIRERQAIQRKDREFGRRLVATLTEGQNALNIAFGAILSAYIGTVLAAIDDKPFDVVTLAAFFVLIGVFIGGLCIGNLVVLRKHFGLGVGFLVVGAIAASLSLDTAHALGFELPILKVMYVCWYAMLIATDALLTAIVFFHHRQMVYRQGLLGKVDAPADA